MEQRQGIGAPAPRRATEVVAIEPPRNAAELLTRKGFKALAVPSRRGATVRLGQNGMVLSQMAWEHLGRPRFARIFVGTQGTARAIAIVPAKDNERDICRVTSARVVGSKPLIDLLTGGEWERRAYQAQLLDGYIQITSA